MVNDHLSNMKSKLDRLLHLIDQGHDAIYAYGRTILKRLKNEAPHVGWSIVRATERLAEIKVFQEAVIILTIGVITFVGFNRSARYFATTDALPNNITSLNIIFNNSLDLTNLKPLLDKKDLTGIYSKSSDGLIYSKTSVFLGIMGVPFFAAMNWLWGIDKLDNNTLIESVYSQYFGKIYASLLSSISAIFMYIVFRKLKLSKSISLSLSLIYALCTNVFNIASQSNIQHVISLFFVTLAMAIYMTNPKRFIHLIMCGALIGFSTQIRISNGFYALFFGLLIGMPLLRWNQKELLASMRLLGSFVGGLIIGYLPATLFIKLHHLPNGYMDEILFSGRIWNIDTFLHNVWALLFSYNYGLFVFSPIFVLVLIGIATRRKVLPEHTQFIMPAFATILTFIAFAASWWMWSGGLSLGARLIIEAIPLGMLMIGLWYKSLSELPVFKFQLLTVVIISLYFNVLTSFTFDKYWHDTYTKPGHESQLRNAWYDKPKLLVYMMQHQFYFDEQLQRKERDGKTIISVRKTRYWGNAYDQEFKKTKRYTLQILPLPE